jgi:hypothetical protein
MAEPTLSNRRRTGISPLAPAYYLGRPAQVWLDAFGPGRNARQLAEALRTHGHRKNAPTVPSPRTAGEDRPWIGHDHNVAAVAAALHADNERSPDRVRAPTWAIPNTPVVSAPYGRARERRPS